MLGSMSADISYTGLFGAVGLWGVRRFVPKNTQEYNNPDSLPGSYSFLLENASTSMKGVLTASTAGIPTYLVFS